MKFTFPLRLTGSLNSREHWAARAKRVKRERIETAKAWRALAQPVRTGTGHWVVTLTRIAPRRTDSDNLAGRLKGVRDQVAAELHIDDGNERVEWRYAQRKGVPRAHAVEVTVETAMENALRRLDAGELAKLHAAHFRHSPADAYQARAKGAPFDERTQNGAKVRTGRRAAPRPRQGPRP
jgi:hypothetical protein